MWAAHVNGAPISVPSIVPAPYLRPVVHAWCPVCGIVRPVIIRVTRLPNVLHRRLLRDRNRRRRVLRDTNFDPCYVQVCPTIGDRRFDRSMFFVVHQGKAAKARSRRRATGKMTAVVPKTTRTKRRKKKKECPADRPGHRLGRRCHRARTPNRTPSTNVYRHSGQ